MHAMSDAPDHPKPMDEQDVDADPLRQFADWYEQAQRAGLSMPDAAAVATATADGAPAARVVGVQNFGEPGVGLLYK
jgi:pyridoxine/pyridoxamine 5'-phosphate oxidase